MSFINRHVIRPRLMRMSAGLITAATAIGLTTGVAGTSPASAASAPEKLNCVVHLSKGSTPTQDCYTTFAEAIRDATNGRVTEVPKTAEAAFKDQAFTKRLNSVAAKRGSASAVAGGTVIGIEYEHDAGSAGGGKKWVVEAAYGCDGDLSYHDWEVRNLGDNWWNDEISSAIAYANCYVRHFEHHEFGGRFSDFRTYDPAMSYWNLNDQTSSLQWS